MRICVVITDDDFLGGPRGSEHCREWGRRNFSIVLHLVGLFLRPGEEELFLFKALMDKKIFLSVRSFTG